MSNASVNATTGDFIITTYRTQEVGIWNGQEWVWMDRAAVNRDYESFARAGRIYTGWMVADQVVNEHRLRNVGSIPWGKAGFHTVEIGREMFAWFPAHLV